MTDTERREKTLKQNIQHILLVLFGTISGIFVILCLCCFLKEQEQKRVITEKMAADGPVNILVLGDSIWDLERGESGIAALLEQELSHQAKVYNLAIKGSRAAGYKGREFQKENAVCLSSMVQYLTGQTENAIPEEYEAAKLISDVDLVQMDYVILAYGLNDYFGAVQQKNLQDGFDTSTYAGAMCAAIRSMKGINPKLRFVVVSPTYCQGYSYGQVIHESMQHDYGNGTGYDYAMTAKEVAASFDGIYVDQYEGLEISIHNGSKYLIDATHLTEKGRRIYAENVARRMIEECK